MRIRRARFFLTNSLVYFYLFSSIVTSPGQNVVGRDTLINFLTATVDPTGHILYATETNDVVKLESDGTRQTFYSNNSLGDIKTIDATNPFKILVFYPEFFTIVFLDRQLVEIDRQSLIDKGYGEIIMAGQSRDGHIWLFDELDHRLKKMNLQGRTIAESGDLRLTLGKRVIPVKIREHGDKVYMITEDKEILTFDLFGNYMSRQFRPEVMSFQISGDNLFLFKQSELEIMHLKTGEVLNRKLPASDGVCEGKSLMVNGEIWCITSQSIKPAVKASAD